MDAPTSIVPLPAAGPLTFVFVDAAGFTSLTEALGDRMAADCLERFYQVVHEAGTRFGGAEISRVGDMVFLVFPSADEALACAVEMRRRLEDTEGTGGLQCRLGLHTGGALPHRSSYIGTSVNKAARIAALADRGQVLLSEETRGALSEPGSVVHAGRFRLRGLQGAHTLYRAPFPGRDDAGVEEPSGAGTAFVGRESVIRKVRRALREHPIVLLIGISGIGKTRLAGEVLQHERMSGESPLIASVDLAGCVDDADAFESVLQSQAEACLASSEPGLLLLDNFEAVAGCAELLLARCERRPNLRLLVTSTNPLDIGEHVIAIPPLGVHQDAFPDAVESESLALFRQRAGEWGLGWEFGPEDRELAERVCTELEGIPLAIELAVGLLASTRLSVLYDELRACRLRVLAAEAGERGEHRHTALRAALSYSIGHLNPLQRRVLLRCAVLAHDFNVPAASALCDADVRPVLRELCLRGLLQRTGEPEEERYAMLASVREFCRDQLGGLQERYEERAADYYLRLGEENSARLLTDDQVPALRNLQAELNHLRSGMDWCSRMGRDSAVARFAWAIWPVLLYQNHVRECEDRIRMGIAAAERCEDRVLQCTLWCRLAGPLQLAGRYEELREVSRLGLALATELGEESLGARCLLSHGTAQEHLGKHDEALRCYQESLDRFQRLGDTWGLGQCYEAIGLLSHRQGQLEEALHAYDRGLQIVQERGDRWSEQRLLAFRGRAALALGRRAEAEALLSDALTLADELGFCEGHLEDMVTLARLAKEAGRLEDTRRRLSLCMAAVHQLGTDPPPGLLLEAGILASEDGNRLTARAFHLDGLVHAARAGRCEEALAHLEALLGLTDDAIRADLEQAVQPLAGLLRRNEAPSEELLQCAAAL